MFFALLIKNKAVRTAYMIFIINKAVRRCQGEVLNPKKDKKGFCSSSVMNCRNLFNCASHTLCDKSLRAVETYTFISPADGYQIILLFF